LPCPAAVSASSISGSTKNHAVVARLFLTPDHVFQVRHARQAQRQRLAGEGEELLEPDDLGIVLPAASRASIRS
jgi:hypothetical protein